MANDDGWSSIEEKYWSSIKDKSKYKDKWVAVYGESILAYGKDVEKVFAKATEKIKDIKPYRSPLFIQCTSEDYLLIPGFTC